MDAINPYAAPAASVEPLPAVAQTTALPIGLIDALRQTRPWVMFLGILGFIFCGLMGIGGTLVGLLVLLTKGDGRTALILLLYPVMAVVYIAPSLFLYRYGRSLTSFLAIGSADTLADAMKHQKSFWRFVGITMIVLLAVYALVVTGLIVFGMTRGFSHHGPTMP